MKGEVLAKKKKKKLTNTWIEYKFHFCLPISISIKEDLPTLDDPYKQGRLILKK